MYKCLFGAESTIMRIKILNGKTEEKRKQRRRMRKIKRRKRKK
jgi:hypothetical protein